MSHFNIIEISTEDVPASETARELPIWEDHLFLSRSDWGGQPVDNYPLVLKCIKNMMRKVATVNLRKRTIRFRSKSAVMKAYKRHLDAALREHKKRLKDGYCSNWKLRRMVEDACGIDDLFYNGYCMTGGGLIEDYLNGVLPQTLHIGSIIDAHC